MVREMDFVDECYADKDLSLLRKLTLVIPTYNRNYYLSRCLWYHAHFPFGQIIVADSSLEEKKVVNRETVSKIREMFGVDILYLEYEPETEKYGGDIYRKWGDAVAHVETEYSQICTDKEFLIPTVLSTLIHFMDSNPDYISSHGNEYGISLDTRDGEDYKLFNRATGRKEIADTSAITRLAKSFGKHGGFANSLLLATTRTSVLKNLYETYHDEANHHDLRYAEIFFAYGGYIAGNVYHNNKLISRVRDEIKKIMDITNNNGEFFCNSKESSTTRYPTYEQYLQEGVADDYYKSISDAFIKMFQSYSNYTTQEIQRFLKSKESMLKSIFNKGLSINTIIINIQKICDRFRMGRRIYALIRGFYHSTFNSKNNNDNVSTLAYYNSELQLIKTIVRNTQICHESDISVLGHMQI